MVQAPNLLLTMINMMLKFGGSPDPAEEDYGLYSVDDEGNSDFQVLKHAAILSMFHVLCFDSVENSAVTSCGAGCDVCTLDAVYEACVLDITASSQEAAQGSTTL